MNIVVLAGGLSMERDVSLASGSLIANALRDAGHNTLLVDLYYGIKKEDMSFTNQSERYSHKISEEAPDLKKLISENGGRENPVGENVIEICKMADVTFLALHGGVGENGKLQALLEMNGIRFTGSSSIGCMLSMDKIIAKELIAQAEIPTAHWLTNKNSRSELASLVPCFVKPADNGSSVGVTKVVSELELADALAEAEKFCKNVLVEEQVVGREFSVGIIDGKALPPIEIIASGDFYNYKVKYQAGLAHEICPANLDKKHTKKLQEYAERAHRVLRLGTYSRIDFILDENGEFFFLEANALPGMTPTSLLPQEAAAAGMSYTELCLKLIELAK
jgi:D-alanine-D-alanine ligase